MTHWHTIAILVNDQPGVLQRVSGLFSRRDFNIESITVGGSEDPDLSRMVIVTVGDDSVYDQIIHQLEKLVDVVEVVPVSDMPMVGRELALVKVEAEPHKRPEIMALVETFRATVVDVASRSLMLQVVGETEKINAIVELLKPYGIIEICRTGITAMRRGALTTEEDDVAAAR